MRQHRLNLWLLFILILLLLIKHLRDFCSPTEFSRHPIKLRDSLSATPKNIDHSKPSGTKKTVLIQEEKNFEQRIKTIKVQIKILQQKIKEQMLIKKNKEKLLAQTYHIYNKLEKIYDDYFETSAAHVILGPFGAISHIMSEQQLMHQLLFLVQDIGDIISQLIIYNPPLIKVKNKSQNKTDLIIKENMQRLMML